MKDTQKVQSVEEAVIKASLPKHYSFDTFIFNDKPDKPLGWDESIEFAQSNYCSLNPVKDNQRPQMREKAISAWSFQGGAQWHQSQSDLVSKWISCSERLPEIGDRVLVIDDDGDQFIDIRMGDILGEHTDERWHVYTHWQPLPQPPQI